MSAMATTTTPTTTTPTTRPRPRPSTRRSEQRSTIATYALLLLGAVVTIFPLFIVVVTAFKTDRQIFTTDPWLPASDPTLASVREAIDVRNVLHHLRNTTVFAITCTIGQVIFSTTAAYAFAKLRFPGRDTIFFAYLATLMVPNVVTLIPTYVIVNKMGLVDTFWGLILPFSLGTPFGIFLMRQFFQTIPNELIEAAKVDGASPFTTFWRIVLPISRTMILTLAVVTFVASWNQYLWPLIVTSSDARQVLTVAAATLNGSNDFNYALTMAFAFIATLPLVLLYLVFQRQIVNSIATSGLKS
jgi:multiple sugar transport system permease protein